MNIKREMRNYLIIYIGTFILSFGLFNIHARCAVTEGGVLGGVLLLENWFGWSPSVTNIVLDLSCYAVGFRFLGWDFARYSLAASLGFSVNYRLAETVGYIMPDLTPYPLMAALLGALFVGVGVGLCVRVGGAAGGDDALAMTISKVMKVDIAWAYMFTDLLVLSLSLTYIP
ncbi:MAG: YitT family protein, partial [Clostridia bacterium]|nr:YitT family protein [Clostridia bacterium]